MLFNQQQFYLKQHFMNIRNTIFSFYIPLLHQIRLIDPATIIERYNNDSVSKQLEAKRRIYGADEITETLAVADIEGETLVINPTLVRYGDKWYIASVGSIAFSILGIDTSHQALFHIKGPVESLLLLMK